MKRLLDPEWQIRRFPAIIAAGAALAVACLIVVLLVYVNETSVADRVACNRMNSTRAAVRRVLTFAEATAIASPRLTAEQRADAAAFYRGALRLVPLVNCK